MRTNTNTERPGSPDHDHHSDLTDSLDGDQNFITLLQYRDAYHVLGLPGDGLPPSRETIQDKYESAKEQVLTALENCEAPDEHANRRNVFFVSQQNYLELKLKALDQARDELMDENSLPREGAKDPTEEGPSISTNAAVRSVSTNNRSQTGSTQHHRQISSEDELDTIDIYFRPNPNHSKSLDMDVQRPKHPADPSDVSTYTWDGSSIFSMASKYDYSPGQGEKKAHKGTKTPTHSGSQPPKQQSRLPPLGIKTEHSNHSKHGRDARPTAKVSPKSVIDFHTTTHIDSHAVGRGKVAKGPQHRVEARHTSHEATEAARMGILRALSEENSECLPLDDENDDPSLALEGQRILPARPVSSARLQNGKPNRYFQGRSDRMPNTTNSLMASVSNTQQSQPEQSTALSSGNGPSSPPSSTSSESQQNRNELMSSTLQTNTLDSILQAGECSYGAILQSSLELADDICMAFYDCCKMDVSTDSAGLDTSHLKDDESTHFTLSSYGDSRTLNTSYDDSPTVNTQSVLSDGDKSTAINTLSSYSQSGHSSTLSRKMSSNPTGADSFDPSKRMLV